MDIWGLCPICDTWFRCVGWFDRTVPEPTCPSCDEPPQAIENRAPLTIPEPNVAGAW